MANYEQPDFVDERVRFFDGQFLKDQDFIDEQKYYLDRLRRHARFLNVAGIVEGFTVEGSPNLVTVKPGTALDNRGRQVVLAETVTVPLADYKGRTVDLIVAYGEEPYKPQAGGGEWTRFRERPYVGPRDKAPRQAGDPMVLAKLIIDAKGTVTVDPGVRIASGLRLPDGRSADASTWPALRVSDGAVTLTGSLNLKGGKIQVDGGQQITFTGADTSNNLKVQLWKGFGLGINKGTLFYAASGKHSWRDEDGDNERMALTTGPDGGLSVTGTGDSSFAGKVGIGTTAAPKDQLEVTGGLRILTGSNPVRFTSAWSNFPNEGGVVEDKRNQAEIANDTKDHQALIIAGNRSKDKTVRRVSVWDRLEVHGDVEVTGKLSLGAAKLYASGATESVRMLRGVVRGDGQASWGTGFAVAHPGRASYTISFTEPFADLPAASVTLVRNVILNENESRTGYGEERAMLLALSRWSMDVLTAGRGPEDLGFSFLVIGPA